MALCGVMAFLSLLSECNVSHWGFQFRLVAVVALGGQYIVGVAVLGEGSSMLGASWL